MNSRYPNHVYRHLAVVATAAALAFTAGTTVAAQYQWRDAKGRMVYSDLPPPTSVAPDRIIRGPSVAPGEPGQGAPAPAADDATGMVANAATKVATNPGVNSAPGAGEAGLSIADRELASRKRAADRAAEEKKAAEEASRKIQLARACSDAQGNIRMLESGQRISRVNAAGEREFLSDSERMQRLTEARKNVGERC